MGSIINFGTGDDSKSLININIKELFTSLANIPTWLKWLLCISVITTVMYFTYEKFFDPNRLDHIISMNDYLEYLEETTSTQVKIEDYHKDYVQFYGEFDLVRTFLISANETHKLEMDMIIDYFEHGDARDKDFAIRLQHVETYYKKNMDEYMRRTSIDNNIRKPEDSNVTQPDPDSEKMKDK